MIEIDYDYKFNVCNSYELINLEYYSWLTAK